MTVGVLRSVDEKFIVVDVDHGTDTLLARDSVAVRKTGIAPGIVVGDRVRIDRPDFGDYAVVLDPYRASGVLADRIKDAARRYWEAPVPDRDEIARELALLDAERRVVKELW